jgi:hypothetical protein
MLRRNFARWLRVMIILSILLTLVTAYAAFAAQSTAPQTSDFTIDYAKETLGGTSTLMEYSTNGTTWTACTANMNIATLIPASTATDLTLKIRLKAVTTGTVAPASASCDVTISKRPAASSATTVKYVGTTDTIDGVVKDTIEYKLSTGTSYTACTDTKIAVTSGTAALIYNVRVASTTSAFASTALSVTVPARAAAPSATYAAATDNITGVTSLMEWVKIATATTTPDFSSPSVVTGTTIGRSAIGDTATYVAIRIKATATAPVSQVKVVTVPAAVAQSADLTGLVISGSPSNYTFSGSTYIYTGVTVANGVASVTVTPTGSGTITVQGVTVAATNASSAIALTAGTEKVITVVVTEIGKAAKTYTIKITRAAASGNFVAATKNIPYNDAQKFQILTSASSSNTAVATASVNSGNVVITSVSAGTAKITINGDSKIYIPVTVASNGSITVPGNTVFTGNTDTSTYNGPTDLGLTATSVSSDTPAVATAVIDSDVPAIDITAVSAGTAIITATDGSGHTATIPVAVAADGTITLGTIEKYGEYHQHTITFTNVKAALGFVPANWALADPNITGCVEPFVYNSATDSVVFTSNPPGTWTATNNQINFYKTSDYTSSFFASIWISRDDDGTLHINHIAKDNTNFAQHSDSSISNDVSTLGLVGTLATGGGHPSITNGKIVINANQRGDVGPVRITVGDGTGHLAYINAFINGDGTISIDSIEKYVPVFYSEYDISTYNNVATLGLTGTSVDSSDDTVATASLIGGKTVVRIDSVSPGTATITVTDASGHTATVDVTVDATGIITVDTITPYGE